MLGLTPTRDKVPCISFFRTCFALNCHFQTNRISFFVGGVYKKERVFSNKVSYKSIFLINKSGVLVGNIYNWELFFFLNYVLGMEGGVI